MGEFSEGNIKAVLARIVSQFTERAMEGEFEQRLNLARAKAAVEEYERSRDQFVGNNLYADKVRAEQRHHEAQVNLDHWRQIREWTFEKLIDACPVDMCRDIQIASRP